MLGAQTRDFTPKLSGIVTATPLYLGDDRIEAH
jgi:hypothetical protein